MTPQKLEDQKYTELFAAADENASHTGKRYIEPYVFGVTKAGNDAIRAYQYWGDTKKGTPAWKLFRLDRIESWEPTGEKFELEPQARGWASQAFNKGGDKSLVKIYTIAKLDDEPLTDYEKLKADENLGNLFVELVKSAINIGIHFNQLPCQEMMQTPYTNLGWIVEEIYFQK